MIDDGRLYKGRTGVAGLAGAPVFPVGTIGTERVQPIGHSFRACAGTRSPSGSAPLHFAGTYDDRVALRAFTDEVMASIQKLTGQTYVPEYAPSKVALPPAA
jgi:1-acyl-sn-glycerol-3-phosphate acyltransferase